MLLEEIVLRFMIGGVVVSLFAVIGDVLKPESFAGIFGTAPSVALATLALTFATHPPSYVAFEGRSMLVGAVGMLAYCLVVGALFMRAGRHAVLEATVPWILWLIGAFGLWGWLPR